MTAHGTSLEIGLQDVKERLRHLDRTARIDGELHFPEHPSCRRDVAAVKAISRVRGVSTIYILWKTERGGIRYRKMATATAHYNLSISGVTARDDDGSEYAHKIVVAFSAPSSKQPSFAGELSGKLPVGGEKWRAISPKSSVRLVG